MPLPVTTHRLRRPTRHPPPTTCLRLSLTAQLALLLLAPAHYAQAQLSKANRILLNRGLQLQALATKDDVFHLDTCSNANFTTVTWLWDSNPSLLGPAPGFPWARWANGETNMPGPPNHADELPYLGQLVSLQLADEWDLNNDAIRTQAADWFNSVRSNWPNTILYGNNWGGQIADGPLGDFIARAQPDMLCFDSYPCQSDYSTRLPIGWNMHNSLLTSWYSELRRYRQWARNYNIPFGAYRQTFHAVQDYNTTVYRDPSPSELRLNTFGALAFNAKFLINFTYNTGASSLFTSPGGDSYPTALYNEMADINRRALNLGKALVCLKPIYDHHNPNDSPPPPGPASGDPNFPDGSVTSVLMFRGRYLASGGTTNLTDLPNSFYPDPQAATLNIANPQNVFYSWWESSKNDPYIAGWGITNKAGVKNNGLPGEVILSWFTPLDESFDGPNYTKELYFMVVNGLTATDGTAADCMQEIWLNFLATAPSSVVMLDPTSGLLQTNATTPIPGSQRRRLVLDLNGGDAALFKFNDGAPFVGFYLRPAQLSVQMKAGIPVISIEGTPGTRYELQAAPTLPNADWTTLTNLLLLPSSPCVFQDTTFTGADQRFYRAVGLP